MTVDTNICLDATIGESEESSNLSWNQGDASSEQTEHNDTLVKNMHINIVQY